MTKNEIEKFEEYEIARNDCFLCRPASRLLIDIEKDFFAIAGLGPITKGYTIVATTQHIQKLDSEERIVEFARYVSKVRELLIGKFGSCLLTEHGHSPLCTLSEGNQNIHCFHPHVLLFPTASSVLEATNNYFDSNGHVFETLDDALRFGAKLSQYLLVSENIDTFVIFPAENGLPRQFARALVAEAHGSIDLASWRAYPFAAAAEENAKQVRELKAEG